MKTRRKQNRAPNDKKFRELILFIAERSEGDSPFGATKLNKLLFYADFIAFRKYGKAITWQDYQKLPMGPAPKRLLPILRQMEAAEEVACAERNYFGKTQKRAIALREPDLTIFTAEEIALVQEVVDEFWGKSAAEISEISHTFIGWEAARMNEIIPYEVALVNVPEPTETIARKCKKLEMAARKFIKSGQTS